jgi:hypothetical protein
VRFHHPSRAVGERPWWATVDPRLWFYVGCGGYVIVFCVVTYVKWGSG